MTKEKYFSVVRLMVCICLLLTLTYMGSTKVNAATSIQSQEQNTDQNSYVITDSKLIGRYNLNYAGNTNYVTGWIVGTNNGEPGGYSENMVYNDLNFSQYKNWSGCFCLGMAVDIAFPPHA